MIKSIKVTNYLGESMDLELTSPEKSGFVIEEIDGLGPAEADVNITEISSTDGGLFNSSRAKSKDIQISLKFLEHPTIEDTRHLSYKFFPVKHKVRLTVKTDNRTSYIDGYVESNEPQIFSEREGCKISILCANPYFCAVDESTKLFSGVEPLFEFPFSNESLTEPLLEMGEIVTKQYETLFYQGDAETGVTIIITAIGTVGTIRIYNINTREKMEINSEKLAALTGSGLVASDEITICTLKGRKSISLLRAGIRTNILNCLDKDADWFQLSKGDNIFAYVAEEGASNLQFRINYNNLYEGV